MIRLVAVAGALLLMALACAVELEKPDVLPPVNIPGRAPPALPSIGGGLPSAGPAATAIPAMIVTAPVPAPALSSVFSLIVAEPQPGAPRYDRGDWPHWVDDDGDCQDARQEALVAESTEPVAFETPERCRVESGRWTGPYTGTVVTGPAALDVDHMVPLANAHRSGGWRWDRPRKRAYANALDYAGHLVATTAAANRSKGSDGPEDWRPPDASYWCVYATDWASIKSRWGLSVTAAELAALREMLDTCAEPVGINVDGTVSSNPVTSSVTNPGGLSVSPGETTPALTPAAPEHDPEGPDRDCGDFETWDEAQAFFADAGGPDVDPHGLDRGGDGIPCESLPGAP